MFHEALSYLSIHSDEVGLTDHESRVIDEIILVHHAVSNLSLCFTSSQGSHRLKYSWPGNKRDLSPTTTKGGLNGDSQALRSIEATMSRRG
jgi:hypothetical protein